MVVNAFTTNEDEFTDPLTQMVSITLKNSGLNGKDLYKVSKSTGIEVKMTGEVKGDVTDYKVPVTGGGFEFFVIR